MNTDFDYIIVGAGAAGLMLANSLGKDSFFKTKKILLIDKDKKEENDRTWCFWEKGEGEFDSILFKNWKRIQFLAKDFSLDKEITPYAYKMLKGSDFYTFMLEKIQAYPNISFQLGTVLNITEQQNLVEVEIDTATLKAKKVFNSIFDVSFVKNQTKYPLIQQHFVGWVIRSKKPIFNSQSPTFMDFSIPQKGNTRFIYILPFSDTEGLIEYTLFSAKTLEKEEYELAIKQYITEVLGCDSYELLEKEKGNIPMTSYDFNSQNSQNILHIGLAGGWAKASTGYTFKKTQKKTKELISFLKVNKPLDTFSGKDKYWFYDLLLLDILYKNNAAGSIIFESLFKNCSPQILLKFLDEETSLSEDLKVISSCPSSYFIKALFQRIL
ncbi:lycopene cyclase family protein [Eudoraea chungangensis]|uniref:lycopene cyclase family protein n=1 Tax=Eudoraea chungangensis TaxID=1481905 RepID=UPI0023ED79D4